MQGSEVGAAQLGAYSAGFAAALAERGYRPRSVAVQLRLLADLSRWMAEEGLAPVALTAHQASWFLAARRERHVDLTGARALGPLLGYLRGLGVVPGASGAADTPVERLLVDYRRYLVRERGLMASSVDGHERVARLFLASCGEPLEESLRELAAGEVTGFVVAHCRSGRLGAGAGKNLTGGLRSLLRFLHVAGLVRAGLEQAVPSVAGWRLSSLPRALEPDQVARLLSSCDRSTPLGRRDFAIVTLLSRLGLRACEVARLSLDDIDWGAGELTIRGKGSTFEQLPLPHDVGEALVWFLRDGRPASASREVFLSARAPLGPLSSAAVTAVVRYACDRAGVERVGAHRLRHTVATELLRAGTPLAQIAPILRHASVSTTAIYAKIDREALRALARPWPLTAGVA